VSEIKTVNWFFPPNFNFKIISKLENYIVRSEILFFFVLGWYSDSLSFQFGDIFFRNTKFFWGNNRVNPSVRLCCLNKHYITTILCLNNKVSLV
jgi:hypothetical protein